MVPSQEDELRIRESADLASVSSPYRLDIDGLRAVAVVAVLFFHVGWLPNGYLGVDVFFVISGFLITGIIQREISEQRFSVARFYMRRARRILPLCLVVVSVTMLTGTVFMLPDDLENLGQSVVATNLFANNVLQAVTTRNYWDVVNEYKPLMHTWSLGVEEQFYFVYPAAFVLACRVARPRMLLAILVGVGVSSLALNWMALPEYARFYLLPFRLYELAAGGVVAAFLDGRLLQPFAGPGPVILLLAVIGGPSGILPQAVIVPAVVVLTSWVVASANGASESLRATLGSTAAAAVGRLSFSLYMWHQPVLAFTRYAFTQQPDRLSYALALLATAALSIASYFVVEQPFRDSRRVSGRVFLVVTATLFMVSTACGLYLSEVRGVIRDVPELGVRRDSPFVSHAAYNSRIRAFDRPFGEEPNRIRVLVIGNSFARDWANVLLESASAERLDMSYIEAAELAEDLVGRIRDADVVFHSPLERRDMPSYLRHARKWFIVGVKNFGCNAGYFYNHQGPGYFQQRTEMEDGYWESNAAMRADWGGLYIDLIAVVADSARQVPVFTPDGMFISQDCRHLTQAGARYFAQLMGTQIASMLGEGDEPSSVR